MYFPENRSQSVTDNHRTSALSDNDYKILYKHGYIKIKGMMFECDSNWNPKRRVVIKKCCVWDKNVMKEAFILEHLSLDNTSIGNQISSYIELIGCEKNQYLVTEFIDGPTLKEFVLTAHEFIASGRLNIKQYQKSIKLIFWQIMVVLKWMHDDMRCCHLNFCVENIVLENANFIEREDATNSVIISPNIKCKHYLQKTEYIQYKQSQRI